jgi:hypothetical protein
MNSNQMPSELSLSMANCCALASEVWRLGRHADLIGGTTETVGLRYSVRQLTRLLEEMKLAIVDLVGQPYDSGMIQEVVEVIDDPEMDAGRQLINETVLPTITWNGIVAQPGQVSLRRSLFPSPPISEVSH